PEFALTRSQAQRRIHEAEIPTRITARILVTRREKHAATRIQIASQLFHGAHPVDVFDDATHAHATARLVCLGERHGHRARVARRQPNASVTSPRSPSPAGFAPRPEVAPPAQPPRRAKRGEANEAHLEDIRERSEPAVGWDPGGFAGWAGRSRDLPAERKR